MKADAFQQRRIVDDLCRSEFASFAIRAFPIIEPNKMDVAPHVLIVSRLLMRMYEGEVRRAVVCMPPRYLKTYLISVAHTAWLLGQNPKARIICASYTKALAEKFSADTLRLMQSAWYRRVFPGTHLDPKKQSKTEFGTTVGGFRMATSIEAYLTGRGADVIIIDDPLKASDAHSPTARNNSIDWFNSMVHTRFDNPKKGKVIVVAQRLHQEDLPGHIMELGSWEELILPAINPKTQLYDIVKGGRKAQFAAGRILQSSRHDEQDLEKLKLEMGEQDFEAQFNQCPLPPGGATIKETWVKRYEKPPKASQVEAVIQSWDTAYEGDEDKSFSVCTTWAKSGSNYYLLDVWRDRPSFPALRNKVYELKKRWKAKMVIVEKKASGISLIETINHVEKQKWLISLSPEKSKVERAQQQSVKFEQGRVWLPTEADWLTAFENELFSFPQCKFDDQVDSVVQLLTASDYPNFHNNLTWL